MMDRGEREEALDSITKAFSRLNTNADEPLSRGPSQARLLPSLIEIALAADDVELARRSIAQLEKIANAYESQVWQAAAVSAFSP